MSCILRFINNANDKNKNTFKTSPITAEEMDNSKRLWIKFSQINLIDENNFKQLRKDLRLFVDNGIFRCRGRIENADLEYDTKFPIFIFYNCHFAKLLILHLHKLVKYNGVKETFNALRSQYWIPCCRLLAKSVIRIFTTCRRIEGKSYSYPPAQKVV
ncbi:uncharacterized protein LOC136082547 [Hydra vulgaris]|uniref:Uncharacterized protein LOC136082547 n=1 Tax=Hydra vulgaris TaxID=6087 RepID=A0ABM4C8T4_HYDVU